MKVPRNAESSSEEEVVQKGRVKKDVRVVDKTERCLKILDHTSNCDDVRCTSIPCRRMKCVIRHSQECKSRRDCQACRQLVALCFQHASLCTEKESCKSLYCDSIRRTFYDTLQNVS